MSKNNRCAFCGTIIEVRAVEDCIRATKKYTEGLSTMRARHPVQGEDFPSKKFVKYYEVYPEVNVSWDMSASMALDWLWGETPCINVLFNYDYRSNKAEVVVKDGSSAVKHLEKAIPGLGSALDRIGENGKGGQV